MKDQQTPLMSVTAHPANRRSFLRKLGIAGAALGATASLSKVALAQSAPSDGDILNFALNLEYLEAEFYTIATTGQSISQSGITVTGAGTPGSTIGGSQVTFTDSVIQAIAQELASDERDHVSLLQSALAGMGVAAVARPAINLNALGFGFANQNDFLRLARIFEDIGVTAYGGAAPLISSKTILGYAARILAVEAAHAGNIRLLVARAGITTTPLDGADHTPPPSGSEYFPTDSMALTEVRTPGQVLSLAYAASNVSSGGFFPNGVNGGLNMSAGATANTDGASLTASPNPIPVTGNSLGVTTLTWSAPAAMEVEIRVNSPSGPLFSMTSNSGSATTGTWVGEGTTFYLQDVSNGKPLTAANTVASVVVHLVRM
jgi:hypothetical protein